MMLTPEKIKGIRFEIWLELLLKCQGYKNVLRNVEYHKKRYVFRQVDVSYNIVRDTGVYLAIVEAKYSSNGDINYQLRRGEVQKAGQEIPSIDNIIDEVFERRRFVGADLAFLVTNKHFEDRVRTEARKYGIRVIECGILTSIYRSLGGKGTIDDSIRSISVRDYNLNPNIIHI